MYRLSFVSAFAVLLWVLGFIVYLPVWQAGMEDSMKYGYFDDGNREYVITEPKTPLPWINYLGCEDFFSLISNTCGGYSFYKDARLLRLTRYRYNNVPYDTGGHYYYINDGGTVWNPGWQPSKTELDEYSCRHGMGYSIFTGKKNGVKAEVCAFVPIGDNCEVHKVSIRNETGSKKRLALFSFVEFCLWNAMDDMTNFQRNLSIGEVEVSGSVIYHKTEYRERRNHFAFFGANCPIDGFDTDRDAFLGAYNGFECPASVAGHASNSMADGWAPIASHQINLELEAGEEKVFVFVLGYAENPQEEKWEAPGIINKAPALAMLDRYNTADKADLALLALKEHWGALLSKFHAQTGDEKLDRMINIWHPYQCMVTFNMSRSASYYESGIGRGMGFRDSCQDLLGFVHLIPDRARERILDIASTQFEDGSAYHQYQPLTKKGNADIGSGFNDDPLWLIAGTAAYIRETGDLGILEEMVPFDGDTAKSVPLMEHLRRSFRYTLTHLGPHNLPLIGRADWNDCLNLNCFSKEPGEPFQTTGPSEGPVAESVFIAGMFVKYGAEYARLCRLQGLTEEALEAECEVQKMYDTVLDKGWDGEWFLRAYDANGDKVGSSECADGQIYIEPQGFCVLAGIGVKEGHARKALKSVEKLLDTKYGIVLLQPAYKDYHLELGEVSSYPCGYKENAGIFCHNNPWITIAETVMGNGERAFDTYRKICPAYIEDISDIHRTEPYVYSQMIAGKDASRHGEAKNSWLTGTAAWTYLSASQYILGIRPSSEGLVVDPCLPEHIKKCTVSRTFRNTVYHITILNPDNAGKGVKKMTVDGKEVDGNTVPIGSADEVEVIVQM